MNHTPFRGAIPDGPLDDTAHDMWVRREGDGVVIGASRFGLFLAGGIIGFTAKPKGAEVALARGLGTVECAENEPLIPEYGGTVVASAFVARTLDPEWAARVF